VVAGRSETPDVRRFAARISGLASGLASRRCGPGSTTTRTRATRPARDLPLLYAAAVRATHEANPKIGISL
jgi:hypothetical protein